ncbi:PIN domain-containing protein [Nocardiopsis sp. N85]|uniref:PIN domain-containing protein n=1 Tax=Nocardiopsis sp. N85 TaxID=3029400 RepID=UPI00237F9A0F|nr:PIN domain-containing protein [Nocardiopsis sp. N85]MDE3721288.1 PIN domain-containing protein [Nocardiopsis sp. N85]
MWSDEILDELRRNVKKRGIPIDHRIAQMRQAFPDATVDGYEPLVESMTNDEKDRHVLAAAVRGSAEVIVTRNTKHFPGSALAPYDLSAVHPDDFLLDQLDLHPGATLGVPERQADPYRREPTTVLGVLSRLERDGVPGFAAEVRRHLH